jgi:tRNA modification GTPase
MVELELDFIEEDVEFADKEQLRKLLTELDEEIGRLLDTYETGRLVKDGVKRYSSGGRMPGKSTLLNTLIGTERAIVTEIAGTTRDTIDADWSYDGLLFKLIDTAGLRETEDLIEAEGVKRSQKAFEQADLVVYLKDLSLPMMLRNEKRLPDFQNGLQKPPFADWHQTRPAAYAGVAKSSGTRNSEERMDFDLKISALEEQNIGELKKLMKQRALENKDYDTSSLLVTSSRHRDGLQKARENVRHVPSALLTRGSPATSSPSTSALP